MGDHSPTANLTALLDQLADDTEGGQTSLGDLLDALDSRSFGPMLLIPALIAVSPLGGIPGMSLVTGSMIVLLAGQLMLGASHPWLPTWLLDLSFSHRRLEQVVEKSKPWVRWLEKPIQSRWEFLAQRPASQIVAAICILLAASFYPLALLPFAVAVPGIAIVLFAVGLTAQDGLLILLGLVASAAAAWALIVAVA